MLEAYKNFWLGYLDFYGRTKRSDYWWVVLINGIIGSLIFLLMDFLGETKAAGFTLTAFILFIAATVPSPPSPTGKSTHSESGRAFLKPRFIASATWLAGRLSLKESGAIIIFILISLSI